MIVRNLRLEASSQLAKLQSKWQSSIIYCRQLLQKNIIGSQQNMESKS